MTYKLEQNRKRVLVVEDHEDIIALSGHVGEDFRAEARAAGCDALLTKPIDLPQLMNTLNELLYSHSRAA